MFYMFYKGHIYICYKGCFIKDISPKTFLFSVPLLYFYFSKVARLSTVLLLTLYIILKDIYYIDTLVNHDTDNRNYEV